MDPSGTPFPLPSWQFYIIISLLAQIPKRLNLNILQASRKLILPAGIGKGNGIMLLSTSYLPGSTGGRIPPPLFDLYLQYKQDTKAIIAWLMSHGTNKFKRLRTVSIRDLLGLAEVVQKKAVVMPDTIDFQFREAIAARTQLSTFFRTSSGPELTVEDTVNHEFFTER